MMLKLMIITIMIEIMMMMITIMINFIDTHLPKNLLKSFKDLFYAMTGYQYSNSAISVSRDKIDTWPVIVFRMLAPYGGYVDIEVFPTVTVVLLYLSISTYLPTYLSISIYISIYLSIYLSMCTCVCIWIYISACLYVVLIRPMHISVYFICADYLYVLFSIYTCICLNKILLFIISYMHFIYIYGIDIYYVGWELIDIDIYDDCLLLNRFN